jgi:hypothetical protein
MDQSKLAALRSLRTDLSRALAEVAPLKAKAFAIPIKDILDLLSTARESLDAALERTERVLRDERDLEDSPTLHLEVGDVVAVAAGDVFAIDRYLKIVKLDEAGFVYGHFCTKTGEAITGVGQGGFALSIEDIANSLRDGGIGCESEPMTRAEAIRTCLVILQKMNEAGSSLPNELIAVEKWNDEDRAYFIANYGSWIKKNEVKS